MNEADSKIINLIAPAHDYTSCTDEDLKNYDRICTRCHFLAYLEGWMSPADNYGMIIYKRNKEQGQQ